MDTQDKRTLGQLVPLRFHFVPFGCPGFNPHVHFPHITRVLISTVPSTGRTGACRQEVIDTALEHSILQQWGQGGNTCLRRSVRVHTWPEDYGVGPSEETQMSSKARSVQQHTCPDPFLGDWLQLAKTHIGLGRQYGW